MLSWKEGHVWLIIGCGLWRCNRQDTIWLPLYTCKLLRHSGWCASMPMSPYSRCWISGIAGHAAEYCTSFVNHDQDGSCRSFEVPLNSRNYNEKVHWGDLGNLQEWLRGPGHIWSTDSGLNWMEPLCFNIHTSNTCHDNQRGNRGLEESPVGNPPPYGLCSNPSCFP